MRESQDRDGTLRLALLGELDIAVAGGVQDRLRQYADAGRKVRLDLSQLDFIDSSGVRAVLMALKYARRRGQGLEVDRQLSATTRRIIEIMGIERQLWPRDEPGE
jgi:anti-sigma B factor antagonist